MRAGSRGRRAPAGPARPLPVLGAAFGAVLLAGPTAAPAGAQPYLGGGIGFHRANALGVEGRSNDGPSYCDEHFNPHFARIPECREPGAGRWLLAFGAAAGSDGSAVVGYRFGERWRFELEYFFRASGYDRFAPATGANEVALGKFDGELVRAEEYVGEVNTHGVFANLLFDFANPGPLTPFLGLGAGAGRTQADYGSVWARNPDPEQIRSGAGLDLPDYRGFREALAATTTTYHGELTDLLFAWQALAGFDLDLSSSVTLGLTLRYLDFARFEVEEPDGWDQLRSHASGNRLDGSAPAWFWIETGDLGLLGGSLTLKYSF